MSNPMPRVCPICGSTNVPGRRYYCSDACARRSLVGFASMRKLALEVAGHVCFLCGSKRTLEVHHILMRSKGGTHHIGNLLVLCAHCHDLVHAEYRRAERRGEIMTNHANVFEYLLDYLIDMGSVRPHAG